MCVILFYIQIFTISFAAIEPSLVSTFAFDAPFPLIPNSSSDSQIAHKDRVDLSLRSDISVSNDFKHQEQQNTTEKVFKQDFVECVPTSNISDNKSTIQSGILTQSAGESLLDLAIDPNSPKGDIGRACFEKTLKSPSAKTN